MRADDIAIATEQFAAATALLPKTDGLAGFASWLVEGCRATQPLEAFAGKMLADSIEIAPGAVVSVQATIDTAAWPGAARRAGPDRPQRRARQPVGAAAIRRYNLNNKNDLRGGQR